MTHSSRWPGQKRWKSGTAHPKEKPHNDSRVCERASVLRLPQGILLPSSGKKDTITPDGIAYLNANRKLKEYLDALEYRMLIEVETLMAYGRAHQESDDPPTIQNCFLDFRTYVNKPEGKPMAVEYIAGKAPLGTYLKEALLHCDLAEISLDV